jgi:hypothetical protein
MRRLMLLLLVLVGVHAAGEGLPIITVLDFKTDGVSQGEMRNIIELLGTSLFSTRKYQLIDATQRDQLLKEVEFSASDCSDESCQLQIGKLLAATMVVTGTIGKVGSRYLVAAKMLETETSKTLGVADGIYTSLDGLVDALPDMARRLAGSEAAQQAVAAATAELFVVTNPSGAEVLLNGTVQKGESPLLVPKVAAGKVVVEARKDNLYARSDIEVKSGDTHEVTLTLTATLGNILVRGVTEKDLKVYVDGRLVGDLGTGLIRNVPSGDREVVLRGNGAVGRGNVKVVANQTTQLTVVVQEVGSVEYSFPAGARFFLSWTGLGASLPVRGDGTFGDLPVGTHALRITAEDYEPLSTTVTIARGATTKIAPNMRLTEVGKRKAMEATYSSKLDEAEAPLKAGRKLSADLVASAQALSEEITRSGSDALAKRASALATDLARTYAREQEGDAEAAFRARVKELRQAALTSASIGQMEIDAVAALVSDLGSSPYSFADLKAAAQALTQAMPPLAKLCGQRAELASRLAQVPELAKKRAGLKTLSFLLMLGSGVGTGVFAYLGAEAYKGYEAATTTIDASRARGSVQTMGIVTLACGGGTLGGLLLTASGASWEKNETRRLQSRISILDGQIAKVTEELK